MIIKEGNLDLVSIRKGEERFIKLYKGEDLVWSEENTEEE